jgi:hypothetical protein
VMSHRASKRNRRHRTPVTTTDTAPVAIVGTGQLNAAGGSLCDSSGSVPVAFAIVASSLPGDAPRTEGLFSVGSRSFVADAASCVAVSGTRAHIAGTGTWGTEHDYSYILIVEGVGGTDRVRLRIASPNGVVVFDNARGSTIDVFATPLQSLSIGAIAFVTPPA